MRRGETAPPPPRDGADRPAGLLGFDDAAAAGDDRGGLLQGHLRAPDRCRPGRGHRCRRLLPRAAAADDRRLLGRRRPAPPTRSPTSPMDAGICRPAMRSPHMPERALDDAEMEHIRHGRAVAARDERGPVRLVARRRPGRDRRPRRARPAADDGAHAVKAYGSLEKAPAAARAVAIGSFDGVHLGHRRVIERTIAAARERDLTRHRGHASTRIRWPSCGPNWRRSSCPRRLVNRSWWPSWARTSWYGSASIAPSRCSTMSGSQRMCCPTPWALGW